MQIKSIFLVLSLIVSALFTAAKAQETAVMTPERLLQLGRVFGMGITPDKKAAVYGVRQYDVSENKGRTRFFTVPLEGGIPTPVEDPQALLPNDRISPDGLHKIVAKEVKIMKVTGSDFYPDLPKSNVKIYNDLNYRHWDTWEDGAFSHIFVQTKIGKGFDAGRDIMAGTPYDCPQKPFGGDEDYIWSPDSKHVLYVTKRAAGAAYALSTNTDIFDYDLQTGKTSNITQGMQGYDNSPAFSSKGVLAWLSMKSPGYESDKNDIIVLNDDRRMNLTRHWDGTVNSFKWSQDGSHIYFVAPTKGTVQLFVVDYPGNTKRMPVVKQVTQGQFDIRSIVGQAGERMVVARSDMNHASELYTVDLPTGQMTQLTHVNDSLYSSIRLSKVVPRYCPTTDGKRMLSWVIYPPDFDPAKKYPTLLYLQGGPQGALSQFYSFRWNFQLMAAHGYIVIAPNRRGMPGWGVKWNEAISKDYGGQCMRDYLSSIDDFMQESYVDKDRIGAIGASFGGYSAFYLMGNHEGRFKTFVSHDGIFDWYSMYGTTEEMWFPNWDLGGAYWEKDNPAAQKAYNEFNPMNYVNNWNRPILIIQGGHDYRVPIGQGLAAFQAAKLKGLKSRLLYFPEENHWVLQAQNSLVWHREFYKWLKETL